MAASVPVDQTLFLRLFLSERSLLKGFLLGATGNLAEAEDLLQEVSAVLWQKFATYDRSAPFRPWAMGVARNHVLRWRERARRRRMVLSEETVKALTDVSQELAEELESRRRSVQDCLKRLPGHIRGIVSMRYVDGIPISELANRTRRSVAAVEMALVRARRALRECAERGLGRPLKETP